MSDAQQLVGHAAPAGTAGRNSRRGVLRTLAAGAAAPAAGALAACGAGGTPEAVRKERTTAATVRFMPLANSAPWVQEQFDRFNREVGPALKIQLANEGVAGQAELWTKYQSTYAAGDPPDVTRLKEIWVFEMFLKDGMKSLDGYFKADKDFKADDLLPLYQDNFKFKGQHYAIAREVSIIVGYYNKELFKQNGLDPERPPETYDQFREFARKTTKAGPTPTESFWGFDPYEYGTREFVFLWPFLHMRRFGADFWNRDKTGIVLNTPAHVEALSLFLDMIHKDRSVVPNGVGVPQSTAGGRTGKMAMWEQGTWDIPLIPVQAPDLQFGVFLWPKKANQGHVPLAGSSAMSKASKEPDAAWEFMKWWNTPESQVGWYLNAGGNAPSRKSAYGRPPISDSPIWKPLLGAITTGGGNPRPMFDRYTELAETTITPAWMKAFRGEVPAKEALDESTRAATAFWQGIGGNATKAL
jgi:sn-glycerol 3-phosphate transport system substrate-binding protein